MLKRKLIVITILIILLIAGLIYYWYWSRFSEGEITDPTIKRIITQGKIVVGTEATYPPMEYIDEQGNFVGFDIDLAKEIAADLGVEAEFKHIVWGEIFDTLLEGKEDMLLSSITILPERMEIMAFSDPYFNAGQVIVIRKDQTGIIKGTEDLSGKRLGVQTDTTSDFEAQKYTDDVVGYATYDVAKEDLLAGKLDAIVVDYTAGVGLVRGDERVIVIKEPFTTEFYGVAVRKEDKALLERIDSTIVRLKREGRLKEIEKKWFW